MSETKREPFGFFLTNRFLFFGVLVNKPHFSCKFSRNERCLQTSHAQLVALSYHYFHPFVLLFFGQKRCFHPAKGMLLRCNCMENEGLSDASCRVKRMFIGWKISFSVKTTVCLHPICLLFFSIMQVVLSCFSHVFRDKNRTFTTVLTAPRWWLTRHVQSAAAIKAGAIKNMSFLSVNELLFYIFAGKALRHEGLRA